MSNYYIIPTVSGTAPFIGISPDVASTVNYEARAYDFVNNTCKIKTLRDEVLPNGTPITAEEYLAD